jgi:hypothetical protein
MNIAEASKKAQNIIEELFVSTKEEQVTNIFTRNGIANNNDRVFLLRECMGVTATSDLNDPLPPHDQYSDELAIFLDGKWRLLY